MSVWLNIFYIPIKIRITDLKAIVIAGPVPYNDYCGQGTFVHWGIFVEKISLWRLPKSAYRKLYGYDMPIFFWNFKKMLDKHI